MAFLENCLTVRFEELYAELSSGSEGKAVAAIRDYRTIPRSIDLTRALGRGRTESGRTTKIGIFRERMTRRHLERIALPDFRSVMNGFGY